MPVSDNLPGWENFYVIVGSCSGALIGLQFVVIALIPSAGKRADAKAISAFTTPTVVHFSAVFTLCAAMSIPWPSLLANAAPLAILAVSGLGYTAIVIRRARHQTHYKPVFEDWVWYTILPGSVYAVLIVATFLLPISSQPAAYIVAAVALGLLFIGIHNAWDTVTFIVISDNETESRNSK